MAYNNITPSLHLFLIWQKYPGGMLPDPPSKRVSMTAPPNQLKLFPTGLQSEDVFGADFSSKAYT